MNYFRLRKSLSFYEIIIPVGFLSTSFVIAHSSYKVIFFLYFCTLLTTKSSCPYPKTGINSKILIENSCKPYSAKGRIKRVSLNV